MPQFRPALTLFVAHLGLGNHKSLPISLTITILALRPAYVLRHPLNFFSDKQHLRNLEHQPPGMTYRTSRPPILIIPGLHASQRPLIDCLWQCLHWCSPKCKISSPTGLRPAFDSNSRLREESTVNWRQKTEQRLETTWTAISYIFSHYR